MNFQLSLSNIYCSTFSSKWKATQVVPLMVLHNKTNVFWKLWWCCSKKRGSYDGLLHPKTKTNILWLISHIFLETFTSKILGFESYRKQIMKINWWNAYKKFLIWYNGYRQNIDLIKRFKLLKSNVNTHKIYRIIIYKAVF